MLCGDGKWRAQVFDGSECSVSVGRLIMDT